MQGGGRFLLPFALLWLLLTGAVDARSSMALSLVAVHGSGWSAQGLQLTLPALPKGSAQGRVDRIEIAGHVLNNLRLDCPQLYLDLQRIACASGMLHTAEGMHLPLAFAFDRRSGAATLHLEMDKGCRIEGVSQHWKIHRLNFTGCMFASLRRWLPQGLLLGLKGLGDGRIDWDGQRLQVSVDVRQGGFATEGGNHAAEGVRIQAELAAQRNAGTWRWQLDARWHEGAVYWAPFYVAAAGQQLAASGKLHGDNLEVTEARLVLPDLGALTLRGAGNWRARQFVTARLDAAELDLARLGRDWLSPWLQARGSQVPELGGQAAFSLHISDNRLTDAHLSLHDASITDGRRRFRLKGLNGVGAWSESGARSGQISVAQASWGRLASGSFAFPLTIMPRGLHVPRIEIPLLDGQITIDHLRAGLDDADQPDWELGLALYPIALGELTEQLGLPRFAGRMSASIPRIYQRQGEIGMDGALVIQAFAGYFSVDHLRLIDPFGLTPRFFADVELRNIDLELLTSAFSFGRITGFVDGRIDGLQLANWSPQAFAARIESAPGDYPRRISQRAVENISALGGAGATAALQRSFLRFFEDFGYARIGLSCVLRNRVCEMGGLAPAPQGYVIVEGGGIPSLNVIGYNRWVDWPELVDRLKRITDRNTRPVIR